MIYNELKSMVAQSCPEYSSKNPVISMISMGNFAQSCDSCLNYVSGKCIKALFEEIGERIIIN